MKTRYIFLIYLAMALTDVVIIDAAVITASGLSNWWPKHDLSMIITASYIWILAAVFSGLYKSRQEHRVDNVIRLTLKSFFYFCCFFAFYTVLAKNKYLDYDAQLFFFTLVFIGLFVGRSIGILFEKSLKKYFRITKTVAIIGHNFTGLKLANFFQGYDNHYAFSGFINAESNSFLDGGGQVSPAVTKQFKSAASNGIKELYVSLSPERITEYNSLKEEAEKDCLRLKLVPDLSASLPHNLKLSYMGGFAVLAPRTEPLEEIGNRFKKRMFDILFSSLVIIFLLSWLYPLIGLLIKLQSPGPILFKQIRSTKDNLPFICYKFRSMKMNNENKQATENDDRITRIGHFLRRTSLDELPQFFNVFLGNMSVVGPRPHPLFLNEYYNELINQYNVRHFLKSGITGWAQVSGFRGETKDPELMKKRVECDIWYLENWSMWLDMKIVFLTVYNVLKGEENAR